MSNSISCPAVWRFLVLSVWLRLPRRRTLFCYVKICIRFQADFQVDKVDSDSQRLRVHVNIFVLDSICSVSPVLTVLAWQRMWGLLCFHFFYYSNVKRLSSTQIKLSSVHISPLCSSPYTCTVIQGKSVSLTLSEANLSLPILQRCDEHVQCNIMKVRQKQVCRATDSRNSKNQHRGWTERGNKLVISKLNFTIKKLTDILRYFIRPEATQGSADYNYVIYKATESKLNSDPSVVPPPLKSLKR